MIRDALAHLHWSWLPVLSMFLFGAVFIGVLFWVFRKESAQVYDQLSRLPLQDAGDRHE